MCDNKKRNLKHILFGVNMNKLEFDNSLAIGFFLAIVSIFRKKSHIMVFCLR